MKVPEIGDLIWFYSDEGVPYCVIEIHSENSYACSSIKEEKNERRWLFLSRYHTINDMNDAFRWRYYGEEPINST
jgi:hypothetical protein